MFNELIVFSPVRFHRRHPRRAENLQIGEYHHGSAEIYFTPGRESVTWHNVANLGEDRKGEQYQHPPTTGP